MVSACESRTRGTRFYPATAFQTFQKGMSENQFEFLLFPIILSKNFRFSTG